VRSEHRVSVIRHLVSSIQHPATNVLLSLLGLAIGAVVLAGVLWGKDQPDASATLRFSANPPSPAGADNSASSGSRLQFSKPHPPGQQSDPSAASAAIGGQRYQLHEIVDPVATNGPIFVGWPKPDVALLFSGEQDGYLEPCGCAGLENQKGGTMRRATLIEQLRGDGWPLVAMDLGGQEKRFGVQAELKCSFALRALIEMGYAAVGFGPQELRMDLLSMVINWGDGKSPLVSANVAILGFDSGFTKRYRIVDAGGMRIGITTVLGAKESAPFKNSDELSVMDPVQAISEVLPALRDARCDRLVLLSFADPDETKALVRRFPEFDWVVTARGAEEPPNTPARIEGTHAQLIEVGHKAMYVAVVGLYKDGPTPWRYQRVPLDARFVDSAGIHRLFVDYERQLQTLGLDGLGIKPVPHPTGRKFAGSAACYECHTAATQVFVNTRHAHALETLQNLNPQRCYDPECISCHVTGWDPQKYFPFISGYLDAKTTPQMAGNGCENCHGPSAEHAAAENGEIDADDAELERLRAQLRMKIVDNEGNKDDQVFGRVVEKCMECHDLDNSPDFDFQQYHPKVKHTGKD
jgi:hypothetical protein